MKATGRLTGATADLKTHKRLLTFEVDNVSDDEINRLNGLEKLDITAVRHTEKRSLTANGLMWACLGELAMSLRTDKWTLYLRLLKEYGQYTYIVVRKEAVPAIKKQWRECEEVGRVKMRDTKGNEVDAVQMLCYYGSSTYNSKEFSVLLDGLKYEMEQAGLTPPASNEMQRVLKKLEEEDAVKGST